MTGRPAGGGVTRHAVLISGDPATGKTTLGTRHAARLGAAVIDLDDLGAPSTGSSVSTTSGRGAPGDPVPAEHTRDPRYATLFDVAQANLRAGRSVVLVAPFSAERRDLRRWREVAAGLESAGAQVLLVWLDLPFDELAARLRRRGAGRDAAKIADPQAYLAGLSGRAPVGPHLALDASRPAAELLVATLRQLRP